MAKKTKPAQQPQQPRLVEPAIGGEEPKLYKAGLQAELQKFGRTKNDLQKWFPFMDIQPEGEMMEASGLKLTERQAKALHAIQQLLDKTDYQGNRPGEDVQSQGFRWSGTIPRLAVAYADFFEAYGLTRGSGGSYSRHQRKEALEALKSLTEPRLICYRRTKWKGKEKLYDVIRTNAPVIKILEGWKDLTESERQEVEAGGDVPGKRARGFIVEASPLLMDGIRTFYTLKPASLHREIQQLHQGKLYPRAESLFLEYLLTKNKHTVMVSLDTLAERLRLDKYIRQRKRARAASIIRACLDTAKQLRYLLDFREEPGDLFVLTLNPERCRRIGEQDPGDGEEAE